jgi:hypothetical protein
MNRYDPNVDPSPESWLRLDEQEQLDLVRRYHKSERIKLPNATLHAIIHTVVESQLAQAIPEVRQAFDRLRAEGLDRHDTIHAIGLVLANHMAELMENADQTGDPNARYFAELSAMTAARWRAS